DNIHNLAFFLFKKNKETYKPIGIVKTFPIPPASARAISSERFIEIEKNNGDPFFKYKIIIGILTLKLSKNNILVNVSLISLLMSLSFLFNYFLCILLYY